MDPMTALDNEKINETDSSVFPTNQSPIPSSTTVNTIPVSSMQTKLTPETVTVEATSHIDVSFLNLPSSAVFSKCAAGQFQCVNGTSRDGAYCVKLSAKCDSENDCSDGSDELNCEGCPGNFKCASGQCLKRDLVCNKIVDCDDGSDEKNCEEWKCQFDEFRCPSGKLTDNYNKRSIS